VISLALRPYLAIARISWRSALAYRIPFVLSLCMMVFNLLAMLSLWRVLLASGHPLAGFTWPEMRAYLLVSFVTGCLVSSFTDFTMAFRIQSGLVALDLTQPVHYQRARFAQCLGMTVLESATAAVVCGAALAAFGAIPVPALPQLALFLVSLVAVVPLKFLIVYSSGLLCFWTHNYLGVSFARAAVSAVLSGALVPLVFFPGWLRILAEVLPFQGIASTPALIYLGQASGWDAVRLIGIQLLWIAVLWAGASAAWNAALRRLTIHGG
jgi:ABC-2 type transport system permease protein